MGCRHNLQISYGSHAEVLLLLSEKSKFQDRCFEFEEALPDINSLADHDKVQRLIDTGVVKDRNFLRSFSELLLKEENRKDIMARYPKSERQRLRTVWGFSGLVEQMIRSGEGFGQLAAGFLHGDAMSSHVAHADFEGIGIVMEREYRDAIRRDAANRAHAARIISDQLWFCASRLAAGYRFIGDNIDAVWDVMNDHSDLWSELSKAQQSWYHVEYGAKVR